MAIEQKFSVSHINYNMHDDMMKVFDTMKEGVADLGAVKGNFFYDLRFHTHAPELVCRTQPNVSGDFCVENPYTLYTKRSELTRLD